MKKKITNDENIKNLKKRKILRYFIILFAILTIVFSVLNLFFQVSLVFALVFFVITTILDKVRSKIEIIKKDDMEDIRKEITKNKKKFIKTNKSLKNLFFLI